jgi:putative phage-type endonuclease
MSYPNNHTIPIVDPMEDRERFLAIRKPYFGVSAAACLFGEHPFMSAADYWLEKVAGTQQEETSAMRRGQHLEQGVAMWFAQEQGLQLQRNENMFVRGHLAATPDYWANDQTDLVEIKTTAKRIEEPEDYWLWQVQGQMLCTAAEKAYIVWVDASMDIQWTEVDADPDMQAKLWKVSEAFMQAVEQEMMPDWIEREARHVIAMFPDPSDSVDAGDEGMKLVTDYWSHKAASAYYHDEAAKVRDALFTLAGNHDAITHDGVEIATLRPRKVAAKFDSKRFREENPNEYLAYMGEPTTTRALNIPKKIKAAIEGAT